MGLTVLISPLLPALTVLTPCTAWSEARRTSSPVPPLFPRRLVQLQLQFGCKAAISALHNIQTATNLAGIRRMKAFITTRLIDHYEQLIWAKGE